MPYEVTSSKEPRDEPQEPDLPPEASRGLTFLSSQLLQDHLLFGEKRK